MTTPTPEAIQTRVYQSIADQFPIGIERLTPQTNLYEHLGADSLDQVEMILRLEEEFEIHISDQDAEPINTVGDIIEYLSSRKDLT